MPERFFGYGSLVNLATHSYPNARPRRVQGWARTWRHTPVRPVAFLTAIPAPGREIAGIEADVPAGDWAALDERESAYRRAPLEGGAQIYHIPDGMHGPATAQHPILLSYLDVVVQGYAQVFGEEGVAAFFETTSGWDSPVRDDRDAPLYPRAQILTPDETAMVDDALLRLGVRML